MFGKHFESMYTGSMVGAGALAYAVMGYVISHQKPPSFDVELNPKILSTIIGEDESEIVKTIRKFCEPDEKSRSKSEEGRKLLKLGEYLYHVVNGEVYHKIRTNDERREYFRLYRQKKRMESSSKSDKNGSDVEFPDNLKTEAFKAAWREWNEHLRQKKKRPTRLASERQLKKLSEMGEGRAITAIENSITNNWQGIFEANASKSEKKPIYNAI
jgi:hypothetical protein